MLSSTPAHNLQLMTVLCRGSVQELLNIWQHPSLANNINFEVPWRWVEFYGYDPTLVIRCRDDSDGTSPNLQTHGRPSFWWDRDKSDCKTFARCYKADTPTDKWPRLYAAQFRCPANDVNNCRQQSSPADDVLLQDQRACAGRVTLKMSVFSNPASESDEVALAVTLELESQLPGVRHTPTVTPPTGVADDFEKMISWLKEHGSGVHQCSSQSRTAPFRPQGTIGKIVDPVIRNGIAHLAADYPPKKIHARLHLARHLNRERLPQMEQDKQENFQMYPLLSKVAGIVSRTRYAKDSSESERIKKKGKTQKNPMAAEPVAFPAEFDLPDIEGGQADVEHVIGLLNLPDVTSTSIAACTQQQQDWAILFSSPKLMEAASRFGSVLLGLDFVWKVGRYKAMSDVADAVLQSEADADTKEDMKEAFLKTLRMGGASGVLKDKPVAVGILVVHVPSSVMNEDPSVSDLGGSGDGKALLIGMVLANAESGAVCEFALKKLQERVDSHVAESLDTLKNIVKTFQDNMDPATLSDVASRKELVAPFLRLSCRIPYLYSDMFKDKWKLLHMAKHVLRFEMSLVAGVIDGQDQDHPCCNNRQFDCHSFCMEESSKDVLLKIIGSVLLLVTQAAIDLFELEGQLVWKPCMSTDEGSGELKGVALAGMQALLCEWHLWKNIGSRLDTMDVQLARAGHEFGAQSPQRLELEREFRKVQRALTEAQARLAVTTFSNNVRALGQHEVAVQEVIDYMVNKFKKNSFLYGISEWGRASNNTVRWKLGSTNMLSEAFVRSFAVMVMEGIKNRLTIEQTEAFAVQIIDLENIKAVQIDSGLAEESEISKEAQRRQRQWANAMTLCNLARLDGVEVFEDYSGSRGITTALTGAYVAVMYCPAGSRRRWYHGWLGCAVEVTSVQCVYSIVYEEDMLFSKVRYPCPYGNVLVISLRHHEGWKPIPTTWDFPLCDEDRVSLSKAQVHNISNADGDADATYTVTLKDPVSAVGAACTCKFYDRTGKDDKHVHSVILYNMGAPVRTDKDTDLFQMQLSKARSLAQTKAGNDQWVVKCVTDRRPKDVNVQPALEYRVLYTVGGSAWEKACDVDDALLAHKYSKDLSHRVLTGELKNSNNSIVKTVSRSKTKKITKKVQPARKNKHKGPGVNISIRKKQVKSKSKKAGKH
jgi:hypothetical protein